MHPGSPIQAGAELYGHKGIDADIEVIVLMLSSLEAFKYKKYNIKPWQYSNF